MFAPAVISRPSDKQLSRLRNGHKVRVMRPIGGEGMNLLVDPSRLNMITRSFDKGKGIMVQLSAEEIAANREIGGEGIFGKKFDKLLKKAGIKKGVFKLAEAAKPLVKETLQMAADVAPPQYQGLAKSAAAATSRYIDDPRRFQSAEGAAELASIAAREGAEEFLRGQIQKGFAGKKAPTKGKGVLGKKVDRMLKKAGVKKAAYKVGDVVKPIVKDIIKEGLKKTPKRYSGLAQAADAVAQSYIDNPDISMSQVVDIAAKEGLEEFTRKELKKAIGGSGLYASRGRGVGTGGNLLSHMGGLPPALQSQSAGANFHFSTQLPPSMARIHLSGSGLYL